MNARHAAQAMRAIASREIYRFSRQTSRVLSALVRPLLWLVTFAAGFQNALGVSIVPPYSTYITYQEYILPGLIGIVLLFNGMQSSLALVYDREMGMMRLMLTAPLPRWYLLFCKLVAGTLLSMVQAYAFLARGRAVRRADPVERLAVAAAGRCAPPASCSVRIGLRWPSTCARSRISPAP